MTVLSDYLEDALLQLVFNKIAFSPPSTYVALFTTATGDDGSGTEVSGGGYSRVQIFENASASTPRWKNATDDGAVKKVENQEDVEFPTATADWGTVTHAAIIDAATGGSFLVHGPLSSQQTVGSGAVFRFLVGNLRIRFG